MGVGVFLVIAASFSNIFLAVLFIAAVGGFAGTAYITGFTLLQENVADELRGRTFATLYTIVRLCLLVSLTISPLFADLFDWLTEVVLGPDRTATIGGVSYAVPGVRVALWGGGLVTLASGDARPVPRAPGPPGALRDGTDDDPVSAPRAAPPRFVVLEGADGSGKSTQVTRLASGCARAVGRSSRRSNPAPPRSARASARSSSTGRTLGRRRSPIATTEALLMAADRAQHVAEVVRPALDAGRLGRVRPLRAVVARVPGRRTWPRRRRRRRGERVGDGWARARRGGRARRRRRRRRRRGASQSDRLEREGADFHAAVRAGVPRPRRRPGLGRSSTRTDSARARRRSRLWSIVVGGDAVS